MGHFQIKKTKLFESLPTERYYSCFSDLKEIGSYFENRNKQRKRKCLIQNHALHLKRGTTSTGLFKSLEMMFGYCECQPNLWAGGMNVCLCLTHHTAMFIHSISCLSPLIFTTPLFIFFMVKLHDMCCSASGWTICCVIITRAEPLSQGAEFQHSRWGECIIYYA